MKKLITISVIVIVLALGGYLLFGRGTTEENPFQIKQITAQAIKGDLVVSIHSNGTVTPVQTVEIKSKASGEIIEMPVDAGDHVTKGDLICRLDTTTVLNDYLQAEADLTVARVTVKKRQRDFDRQKVLFEKELVSQQQLDESELALEQAKSSLVRARAAFSTAEERYEDTEVRSPIDGTVLRRPVEEGQIISSGVSNVSGGTLIMHIAAMDSVYVVADVDETDIGRIELGQKVKVNADAFPEMEFEGKVLKISPIAKVEQNVTVFEVTTLIDNSAGLLKAGMNSTIEVITAEAYGAVLVPNDAVKDPREIGYTGEIAQGQQKIPSGERDQRPPSGKGRPGGPGKMSPGGKPDVEKKVVMVKRNGEFVPELVTVGKSNLDYTQVIAGIAAGDTVDATPVSLMMQQRQEFRERMEQRRGSMGGLKKSD